MLIQKLKSILANSAVTASVLDNTAVERDKILLEKLQLHRYGGVVAGGAARLWWSKCSVQDHDIDVWLIGSTDIQSRQTLAHTIMSGIGKVEIETKNAITYNVGISGVNYKVQIINNHYNTCHGLLEDIDITVCKVATDGVRFWFGTDFNSDLKTKTLRITKLKKNSLRRAIKYMVYGFQPVDGLLEDLISNSVVSKDFSQEVIEDYIDG